MLLHLTFCHKLKHTNQLEKRNLGQWNRRWKRNKNKEANERGKKRKGKEIQTSSEFEYDFADELINTKSKKTKGIEIGRSEISHK